MKKIYFILFSLLILSCETPVKKKEEKPAIEKEPLKEVVIDKKIEDEIEEVDNTLISLKRTPCSGDCPVFEVTITKDSILTYNGKEYTEIEGIHTLKLTGKQFDDISKILEASNFSKLDSNYTQSGTQDFAKSILTHQGKDVTVRMWKDAPKELTAIYVFIEDILYDQKYLQ